MIQKPFRLNTKALWNHPTYLVMAAMCIHMPQGEKSRAIRTAGCPFKQKKLCTASPHLTRIGKNVRLVFSFHHKNGKRIIEQQTMRKHASKFQQCLFWRCKGKRSTTGNGREQEESYRLKRIAMAAMANNRSGPSARYVLTIVWGRGAELSGC